MHFHIADKSNKYFFLKRIKLVGNDKSTTAKAFFGMRSRNQYNIERRANLLAVLENKAYPQPERYKKALPANEYVNMNILRQK